MSASAHYLSHRFAPESKHTEKIYNFLFLLGGVGEGEVGREGNLTTTDHTEHGRISSALYDRRLFNELISKLQRHWEYLVVLYPVRVVQS